MQPTTPPRIQTVSPPITRSQAKLRAISSEERMESQDPLLVSPASGALRTSAVLISALFLWSVVCWESLSIEFRAPSVRWGVLFLHLQPLIVLSLCLAARRMTLVLAAFPLSIAICFFALSPLDLRPLNTLAGAGTLVGGLLLFVVVTAGWGMDTVAPTLHGERRTDLIAPRYAIIQRYVWPRGVLLLALFLVPLWALYSPAGEQLIMQNFPDRRVDARVLIHTVHLFITVLAAYIAFLSPAVNLSLEVHDLKRTTQRMRKPERVARYWRTIVMWISFAGTLVLITMLVQLITS